jgi:hypothetical protein
MLCKRCNEEKKATSKKEKLNRVVNRFKVQSEGRGIGKLKIALDAVFSLYIRYRGSFNGMNTCITCSKIFLIKELQDGHYESRNHLALRWDENNNHPQCYHCNIRLKGNYPAYTIKMIDMYGEAYLQMLSIKKHNTTHLTRFEYEMLIREYTKKLNDLMIKLA